MYQLLLEDKEVSSPDSACYRLLYWEWPVSVEVIECWTGDWATSHKPNKQNILKINLINKILQKYKKNP